MGVNLLPDSCPLLLVDLGQIRSDIDSVLRECERGGNNRSEEYPIETRSCAQTSRGTSMLFKSRHNGTPRDSESTDKRDKNSGYQTVVNLSWRVLTQTEVSLLSKGLNFCSTPEKIDIYSLRKDIKEYVGRVRLREYF